MKLNHQLLMPLAGAVLVATLIGCGSKGGGWKFASWNMRKPFGGNQEPDKPDPEIPARLVTTWTETTLTRAGEMPKRGFGGRLSFFKNGSEDPIRVDGQLVVYAFDETSRPEYETQPTRRYVFPAEQFAIHESATKLGPAYSIWLPWDDAGGNERKISLIAKFEPNKGAAIVGEQTKHYLAGPPEPKRQGEQSQLAAATPDGGVQPAAFTTEVTNNSSPSAALGLPEEDRLNTATIPLPSRLAATPGAPRRRPTQALAEQVFTTPHMQDASAAGGRSRAAGGSSAEAASAAGAARLPAIAPRAARSSAVLQLPGEMPTTGYLTPSGLLGGRSQ